jgi:NitT/TauT family transport system substrate-binding protein
MNMMAKKNNISYADMKYIPGSGVRANAMLQKRIKASIVDTERRNLLLNTNKGNFSILTMPDIHASDEALYASQKFIDNNLDALQILIQELLFVWRKTNQNPEYIQAAREQYNLLPKLNVKKEAGITSYFSEMVKVGAYPDDGGSKNAFAADIEFYTFSGTIQSEASTLKEDDFWDFRALRRILNK